MDDPGSGCFVLIAVVLLLLLVFSAGVCVGYDFGARAADKVTSETTAFAEGYCKAQGDAYAVVDGRHLCAPEVALSPVVFNVEN